MALAYAVVYSVLSAIRYRYYLYSDFDLAIFAQACDGLLHGRLYTSIRGMNWLGDHSSLILFLLVPIYAVARHPITLLVIQSLALGLGAIPIHALAKRELGHAGLALVCVALYLFYPALGYGNLFEFHPEMLATPALLAAFTFLRSGRLAATLSWAGVALLCREDVSLVVSMMALYALWLRNPRRRRFAAGLVVEAAASALLTWGVLRPAFSHGEAEYARMYPSWGPTLSAAFLHMLRDPIATAISLVTTSGSRFDSVVKAQYWVALLVPLGMLPLFSPVTMVIALPVLLEHMLSQRTPQHTILCQYTALVTPFMLAATVLGMRNVLAWLAPASSGTPRARAPSPPGRRDMKWAKRSRGTPTGLPGIVARRLVMVWALAATFGCALWFGPLLSSGRFFTVPTLGRHAPTGEERTLADERDRLIRDVPRRGGVVASFEMLNRFTDRDTVHSFKQVARGTFTLSTRPYPVPTGISAVIADMSSANVVSNVDPATASRLTDLVRRNRLAPVAVAGDLLLMLRDPIQQVELISIHDCPGPRTSPIVLDQQLAYVGGGLVDSAADPGGIAVFRTCWRRTGQVDRFFSMRIRLEDASGSTALEHVRDLGYVLSPPHSWDEGVTIQETYRLVLPGDFPPGDYRLWVCIRWRANRLSGFSAPDDPRRYTPERGIDLGQLHVRPR